jgi:hypothetical protein
MEGMLAHEHNPHRFKLLEIRMAHNNLMEDLRCLGESEYDENHEPRLIPLNGPAVSLLPTP